MNLGAILRAADPLRDEPPRPDRERERLRRTMLAGMSFDPPGRAWFPTPRAVVTTIGLFLLVGLMVVGAQGWLHHRSFVQAQVRFEVRLAEDRPVPGLAEARIRDSNRIVYLHEAVVVTNDDIAEAAVVQGDRPSQYRIELRFTDTGTQQMREATSSHVGKPMAVLIDGAVVIAPVVREAVGTAAMVTGDFTRAEAERIVAGIGLR